MKTIKVLSNCKMIHTRLLHEVLLTHKKFQPDDIIFAIQYLCNKKLSDNEFIWLTLFLNQNTNTGRLALSYNYDINYAITRRDERFFDLLVPFEKIRFIELYNNDELTPDDIQYIEHIMQREYMAIKMTIETAEKSPYPDVLPYFRFLPEHCSQELNVFGSTHRNTILYNKCFGEVCIAETLHSQSPSIADAYLMEADKLPEKIYTKDVSRGTTVPITYCFSLMDLLRSLAQNNPVNPQTGNPLSRPTLEILQRKYRREISMYRRYLKQLQSRNLL